MMPLACPAVVPWPPPPPWPRDSPLARDVWGTAVVAAWPPAHAPPRRGPRAGGVSRPRQQVRGIGLGSARPPGPAPRRRACRRRRRPGPSAELHNENMPLRARNRDRHDTARIANPQVDPWRGCPVHRQLTSAAPPPARHEFHAAPLARPPAAPCAPRQQPGSARVLTGGPRGRSSRPRMGRAAAHRWAWPRP
jgi:hypothetical protein